MKIRGEYLHLLLFTGNTVSS